MKFVLGLIFLLLLSCNDFSDDDLGKLKLEALQKANTMSITFSNGTDKEVQIRSFITDRALTEFIDKCTTTKVHRYEKEDIQITKDIGSFMFSHTLGPKETVNLNFTLKSSTKLKGKIKSSFHYKGSTHKVSFSF